MTRGALATACFMAAYAAITGPAFAADKAADTMNEFGLIGTWATTCALDPGHANVDRYSFASNPLRLTRSATLLGGYRTMTSVFDIESAQNVDPDKIKLTMLMRTIESSRPGEKAVVNPKVLEQILQKSGMQIRIIDSRNADGTGVFVEGGVFCPSGELSGNKCQRSLTALMERCSGPN
jgi:hypothetical protein